MHHVTTHVRPRAKPIQLEKEVLPGVVGQSEAMRRVARLVRRCAERDIPTLVRGETGTGKELVARALHGLGPRSQGPFVAINAATLTDDLGPATLFGHVRGAYTGADEPRRGALRSAHRGTLFIDEVAALSPRMQAMLLRVIEEGLVRPVGADVEELVSVRIVSATCEPLEEQVARRTFRPDLFQRLATCVVALPPLRRRPDDVPLLVRHLLTTGELRGYEIDEEAMDLIVAEPLPGNVRELRNVLVQATLQAEDHRIGTEAVTAVLCSRRGSRHRRKSQALDPVQARELVRQLGGNVSAAARQAGMARTTFRDLISRP